MLKGLSMARVWELIKQSAQAWVDDYAPSMGAALAYYTIFSLAPLLLVVIAIAGWFFGAEAARGEIVNQLRGLIGEEGAVAVQGLLVSANQPDKSRARPSSASSCSFLARRRCLESCKAPSIGSGARQPSRNRAAG